MINIYIIFLNILFYFFKNLSMYGGVALWVWRPIFGPIFFQPVFFSANFFSSIFQHFFPSKSIRLIFWDFLLSILILPNHPLEFLGFV